MKWLYKRADYVTTLEHTILAGNYFKRGATEISKKLLEQLDENTRPQVEKTLEELGVLLN